MLTSGDGKIIRSDHGIGCLCIAKKGRNFYLFDAKEEKVFGKNSKNFPSVKRYFTQARLVIVFSYTLPGAVRCNVTVKTPLGHSQILH